jgi:hypothetical protein
VVDYRGPSSPGRVDASGAFNEHLEHALEPGAIDLADDTGELLNPLFGIVDRALEAIVRRHDVPPTGATPLRGWAKVVVRAVDEEGGRVRSEHCTNCGARTNKTQRLLASIAERSSFNESADVFLTPVPDGLEIAVDVDGPRLAGVLADLDELGRWLAKGAVERAGGAASAQASFVSDSFRL